ncbi:MAG: acyl-CoA dehydrogenase family protein [Alphaproteobacteria bacterium]
MNFDFSDEQKQLREQARRFLEDRCGGARGARARLEGAPPDAVLWKGLADLGWAGTAIPEEYGGVGLGYVDLCVIAEELGRFVAPVPFSSSVYLAAEAILRGGDEAQKRRWLPSLASGETIATLALSEGPRPAGAGNLATRFDGGAVTGVKMPVLDADTAQLAVVAARDAAGGTALCLVDLRGPGVAVEAVESIDPSRSHARVTLERAPAEPLAAAQGWRTVDQVLDAAAVLFAFEQVGGADRCLEMARDFALERHAFGRPIGSYQAIKHKLADVWVANEIARSNAYYGAWALANDAADLPVAAATARVGASEAFWLAAKENIQTHGGMGFTWELDCHLYYRRANLLGLQIGSRRLWKEKLVARLETRNAA